MGRFNLSHTHALSSKMGYLVPVMTEEVLPGDMMRFRTSMLVRMMPMKRPVMHPVMVQLYHFFVPTRLVDPNFEDFITEKLGPDATRPTVTPTDWDVLEHMGVPPVPGSKVLADPLRAYNLVWNEYFRDQDLQTEVDRDQEQLLRACWEKDYFTSARPVPQQGDAVTIGVGEGLYGMGLAYTTVKDKDGNSVPDPAPGSYATSVSRVGSDGKLIPQAALDLNELRRSFAIQQRREHRARFGSRYSDLLRSWGVSPQDARLDRPELIATAGRPMSFSEVVSTASSGIGDVVGDLYGHGIGMLSHSPARLFAPEHGWLLSVFVMRPKTQYTDGTPRQFLRSKLNDYWHPESELMGPQAVLNKEVYGNHSDPEGTFGWTGRHDEYRRKTGYVSGVMRDEYDDWHLSREFFSDPALNADFVECNPTDRIFANANSHDFVVYAENQIVARRPVSQEPVV